MTKREKPYEWRCSHGHRGIVNASSVKDAAYEAYKENHDGKPQRVALKGGGGRMWVEAEVETDSGVEDVILVRPA